MLYSVLEDAFEISADGKVIHTYKQRLPYQSIEYFQVLGDVTLSGIHWGGRYVDALITHRLVHSFFQLPWETGFPAGNLLPGQRIYLYAMPKGDRWNIDLVSRTGDILFHFNPRFKDKQVCQLGVCVICFCLSVVRNACRNGIWGQEERDGAFPFEKNRGFDLTIINEPYSMQVG